MLGVSPALAQRGDHPRGHAGPVSCTVAQGSIDVSRCGAVADGRTDSVKAFQTANRTLSVAGGGTLLVPRGAYVLGGTFRQSANVAVKCAAGASIKFTTPNPTGDWSIEGSNTVLDGCTLGLTAKAGVLVGRNDIENITISNNTLSHDPSSSEVVQLNRANIRNVKVLNNRITGGGYGVAADRALTGSGLVISGNRISGGKGDAIEINTISGKFSNTKILNNTVEATAGTQRYAGLGIGAAHALNISIIGNKITGSHLAGIHLEDGTRNAEIANNIVSGVGAGKSGIEVQNSLNGNTTQDIFIHDNTITAGTPNTGTGIFLITDKSGAAKNVRTVGNVVNDFRIGMVLLGSEDAYSNTLNRCETGIRVQYSVATPAIRNNVLNDARDTGVLLDHGGTIGKIRFGGSRPKDVMIARFGTKGRIDNTQR